MNELIHGFLRIGRMTPEQTAAHNGSWYNEKGEKIGWGDLDYRDLWKVAFALKDGEAFAVVGEHESYWAFVKFHGDRIQVDATEQAPGLEFVAEKARHFVKDQNIYTISRSSTGRTTRDEVEINLVSRDEMKKLVLGK